MLRARTPYRNRTGYLLLERQATQPYVSRGKTYRRLPYGVPVGDQPDSPSLGKMFLRFSGHGGTRTPNLHVRSVTLSPIALRAHDFIYTIVIHFFGAFNDSNLVATRRRNSPSWFSTNLVNAHCFACVSNDTGFTATRLPGRTRNCSVRHDRQADLNPVE